MVNTRYYYECNNTSNAMVVKCLFCIIRLNCVQKLNFGFVFFIKGNVLLQGGEVLQENILANVSDDTVSLEFQRSDGTLVTQLIDFRNVSKQMSANFHRTVELANRVEEDKVV